MHHNYLDFELRFWQLSYSQVVQIS